MANKKEIKRIFELGKDYGATHLIVIQDTFEGNTLYRYVKPKQTVDEIINDLSGNAYFIEAIYNYDLDIEEQLKEKYPNHREASSRSIDLYKEALEYATIKHEGQYRKGTEPIPYIYHPINVSKYVESYLKNEPNVKKYSVAALLHDTLEDTDATYEEEKELFGKDIADIVLELTNNKKEKEKLGKDVYLANKMINMNDNTLVIKLCDRLDNVSGLTVVDKEFNQKYVKETTYIINSLLLNRELNDTHLRIINDIMKKIEEVSFDDPILIKVKKKTYHL